MIFELRYKQNDIKVGHIEIDTLRELHRAFWDNIIDIDFANGIIWLYTYVYEEPAFFPADHNLRKGENGVWNVTEGPDMPHWQPKMPFTAYDSHDQYIGHLEVGSLEELSEVCEGSRLNLWFDEQKLNVLPSE
jgi:hypothetical protein